MSSDADRVFMLEAVRQARLAYNLGEVPIGAVVVAEGRVVAAAHNAPRCSNDPSAHAEVLALRATARALKNYRLPGATVYVTVEPCLMCVGALIHARPARVVFGCCEPKTGALGSCVPLEAVRKIGARFDIESGVCEEEARELLQTFFQMRRGA